MITRLHLSMHVVDRTTDSPRTLWGVWRIRENQVLGQVRSGLRHQQLQLQVN